jgi:replicative DNA helicase
LELNRRGEKVNQITVAQELDRSGKLESCGGVSHLSKLISSTPTSLDIESYARIVKNLAANRELIETARRIATTAYEASPNVNETISKAVKEIQDYTRKYMSFDKLISPKDAGNIILDMISEYNQPGHALSWGFKDLDEITSGIYPAEFIVIGGRPSTGKTQLMLDMTEQIANQGKVVLFVSAEMSAWAIMERKVAKELGVPVKVLRRGGFSDDGKVAELAGKVSERTVYYLPEGTGTQDIYNWAQKLKETVGLDIIFVDYLQFLKDCDSERENQNIRVGRACRSLKNIAREYNVPVVAASQLSRAMEYRPDENKHPTLADLRDSGNIEQDADIVFLLYRDETTFESGKKLEIKMAKNRQLGQAKAIELVWNEERHGYVDIYREG